jgi:hypothetical protein
LMIYHICCSSSIHLNVLSFAMNVVVGRYRTFSVFQPMDTLFYRLNDDIHCDLFTNWIHWMI